MIYALWCSNCGDYKFIQNKKKRKARKIRFRQPTHPQISLPRCAKQAHQRPELSSTPHCPTSPASFHPAALMLLPTRGLPAAPSGPAAHPHISPAPPYLRLRRQHGRATIARATSTTPPVVRCSSLAYSFPVDNQTAN